MGDPRDTPAMRQFYRFKRAHPGCVLFFRMGDFYEMFDEDAEAVSKALGLTLTERSTGVPMAGVPYHQLDNYLRRMLEAGFRVAVCDQIQDPKDAKGVVERAVTRVVTPGTLVDEGLLPDDAPCSIAAVCFLGSGDAPDGPAAAAVADLSTGRFIVFDCPASRLVDELMRRSVSEVLFAENADGSTPPRAQDVIDRLAISGSGQPAWFFRLEEAQEALHEQFGVSTLAGFGLADDDPTVHAAGALVRFFRHTQTPEVADLTKHGIRAPTLDHLEPPRRDDPTGRCMIDATSLRSLEVVQTIRSGETEGSLLGVFAKSDVTNPCRTPMGRRLLRDWLCQPLSDLDAIRARHAGVGTLIDDPRTSGALDDALAGIQDVARISGRVALRRATARDLVALGASLTRLPHVLEAIRGADAFGAQRESLMASSGSLAPLANRIQAMCVERPPAHMREGGLIRDGVDDELDEARSLQRDATTWLSEYQAQLIEAHELPSLKVGFNRVFGYYIELPAAQSKRAPAVFTRKQTLKNAERYITPELKTFEEKVTSAESRAIDREQKLFNDLCDEAGAHLREISRAGDVIGELDVIACFAAKAARRGWVRPEMIDEPTLDITQGRHPVLDELLAHDFVPNDLSLGTGEPDAAGASLALITGPNMAGKSTYIRQTALLVLLAHAGSFVPAEKAVIGRTDRVFTRVGADDALHAGQSTFMVEMTETVRILNHATPSSLVILDEIGRGTSTLDGLSLAWAITEFLAGHADADTGTGRGPRTLFATHYHELTDLAERMPDRIRNLHVAVREWGDDIVFLHRILAGPTDQSYGVHVAKLAGVPKSVTDRATVVLGSLAVHHGPSETTAVPAPAPAGAQMGLFTEYVPHPAVERLREVKLEALSPMQAFDLLREVKGSLEA